MLRSFFFENFKSFISTELSIEKLSILIGSNSSGKSNAVEGIRILSELATGRSIATILDGSKNIDSGIRGGSRGCLRFSSRSFLLGCSLQKEDYVLNYKIRIVVSDEDGISVGKESLERIVEGHSQIIFSTGEILQDEHIAVQYRFSGQTSEMQQLLCNPYAAVLPQIVNLQPTTQQRELSRFLDMKEVLNQLTNILFLNPEPGQMRDYVQINDKVLHANAENISAVLYHLCETAAEHAANKARLLEKIKRLPENEIMDIEFVKTGLNDVILTLKEKYGETPIDAKRLSDGTLRCLAVLTALLSERKGSVVVVEEADNGIHPSRARMLLQTMTELADENDITVIATTHNPALLDAIDASTLSGVSLCYREQDKGSSKFVRVIGIPEYFRMAAEGSMGELATEDRLVKLLKESTEKQNSYEWLGI